MKAEKYIIDTLTDYESPMDLNAMWSSLEQQLDKKPRKIRGFWYWSRNLFLTALFLGLSWLAVEFITDQKIENSKIQLSEILPPDQIKALPNPELSSTNTNELNKTTLASAEQSNNSYSQEIINDSADNSHEYKSSNTLSETITAASKIEDSTGLPVSTTGGPVGSPAHSILPASTSSSTIKPIDTETKSISKPVFTVAASDTQKAIQNIQAKDLDDLNSLPSVTSLLKWERRPALILPTVTPDDNPAIKPIQPKPNNWRASVNFGQTKSYFRHTTDVNQRPIAQFEKSTYNSARNNYTAGLGLSKLTDKGFSFGLDLAYINHGEQYIHTEFLLLAHSEQQEKTTVYLTQEGEFIAENTTLFQDSFLHEYEIEFESYHKLHTVQLAPMVGYTIDIGKLDLSLSLGAGLNYFYKQSGEIIEPTGIRKIEDINASTELIDSEFSIHQVSNFYLSRRMKAELGYRIKENQRLFVSAEGGKIFGNTANQNQEYYTSTLNYSGWRAGLSWDF